ncbi:MAG: M48 family metalloprotease [Actinobacteria bacterium]|nr:M48 family metalloprotease [Actinomycetota bacterium]
MATWFHAARNAAKAWLFLGGFVALLTALGWWTGDFRLASLFFVVALLMAATVFWYGPRIVLASLGAREILLAEAPLLYSTVERLALAARVERPKLFILDDGHPRALSVGRGASGSGIAVSRGLLALAPPAELEGLLAHELAHVRHRDVVVQTPAVVIAAWLVEASRVGGFLERALLFVLGPVAASLVQVLLSPKREFSADAFAARICKSPHGLADALIRLEQAQELVSFRANPVTEPLYTVNPFAETEVAALFVTHPPVGERVQRLRALDPDWREKLRAA